MSNITWLNAISADWSTASDWSGGVLPGATDDVFLAASGACIVSIAVGESFTVDSLNMSGGGTVTVAGTLDFDNSSGGSFTVGPLTVEPGGLMGGEGILFGPGPVLNLGTMVGNADVESGGQPLFVTPSTTFTNDGLLLATAGGNFDVDNNANGAFANIAAGVLTGGTYEADSVSTLAFVNASAAPAFTTLEAVLTLNGDGAAIDNNETGTGTFTTVEDALTNIGTAGVLNVLDGRAYIGGVALTDGGVLDLGGGTLDPTGLTVTATGTLAGYGTIAPAIANAGTVDASGGFLTLAGGITGGGALRADVGATMVLNGVFANAITDDGAFETDGGTLSLSGPIGGSGGFVVDGSEGSQATMSETLPPEVLDLATATAGQVAFNGAGGELKLDAPGSFTGAVVGFGAGDSIVLAGIVANTAMLAGDTLTLSDGGGPLYSLALSGNESNGLFAAQNDGSSTTITVSGVIPRDYNFEGPYWQSKTITWSFATGNLGGDGSTPFSSFFDASTQAAEVAIVEQALARWAGIGGFNFVEVPDFASVDIRVGWGDLLHSGLGEIGQASFKFDADVMLPDGIVRIEDPAETALVANAGVIGGLSYSGLATTMYQVALHELGHALGLAHSTDSDAVMFPTAQGAINQDADASDIAGIKALYADVALLRRRVLATLTVRGEQPVETLRAGDLLPGLRSGRLRRVRWIGQFSLDAARHPRPHDVTPIRVCADALAAGVPHRDLLLSPDHALLIGGALVPVRNLVNGATVLREPAGRVTYYHVELAGEDGAAAHDVILAEGLRAESYLETGNRSAFDDGRAMLAAA